MDVDRLRREILGEVCRRIGHDWGQQRTMRLMDGSGTFTLTICKSCGRESAPVVNKEADDAR